MNIKEIRSIYDHANEIENINGVRIIAMGEEHKDWLIEQVEKAEKLENEFIDILVHLSTLKTIEEVQETINDLIEDN